MISNVWENIIYHVYLFRNCNSGTVQVCQWIINFISHFEMDTITYPAGPRIVCIDLLAPVRCCCNTELITFKLIKDRYLEHFLWNCAHVNATRPPWWLVNIGSDNGLVMSAIKQLTKKCWPNSMELYSITRLLCVKLMPGTGKIISDDWCIEITNETGSSAHN